MQTNRIFEPSAKVLAKAEKNVKKRKNFMSDLKNLMKVAARDKELIATLMGLETKNDEIIPDDCFKSHNRI